MRILFDDQIFTWQKIGGISRFFAEIINYTSKRNDVEYTLSVIDSLNIHLRELGLRKNFFLRSKDYLKILFLNVFKNTSRFNHIYSIEQLKNQKFDVFVPTYYDNYFLKYIGNKPFVLTVHDMIHELHPDFFTGLNTLIEQKRELIFKANKIIAVSNNTKKDILSIYPEIDENKIEVVYLSHSINTLESKVRLELPERYILFVGERNGYKNFDFFLQSAAKILNEDKKLIVLCIGGRAFTQTELDLFYKLNLQDQLIQYDALDKELFTIYNSASVFVFPSLYEGFGIPVIEAMASNCPVILTQASSFPEVASNAAAYFREGNSLELEEKLRDIIYNEETRNLYIERGVENSKRFSWDITAANCIKVYQSPFCSNYNI